MGTLSDWGEEIKGVWKDPRSFLNKVALTAGAAGTGFLTGGGYGAAAGGLTEAIRQSRKSNEGLTWSDAGQAALYGGAAGAAAGGLTGEGAVGNWVQNQTLETALKSAALKASLLSGAGLVGYEENRKKKAEEKARENLAKQQKSEATDDIGNIIDGITGGGDPNAPITQPIPNNPTPSVGILPDGTPVPPSVDRTVGLPTSNLQGGVNTEAGAAGKSAAQILAEADLARQYREETLGKTRAAQGTSIEELQNLLNQEAQIKYQRELPGLYEDLNTRGLLMSSELGNQMSKRQQESAQDIALQLAKAKLGYDDSNIGEIKDISEKYLGGRESALGREFSLEDYARQLEASLKLGQATGNITPYQGTSKMGNIGQAAATAGVSGYLSSK